MIAVLCFHKNVRGIAEPRFGLMHPQWLQCGFYVFKLTRSSAAPSSPHVTALKCHLLLTFVMLVRNGNQWKADCHQLTCSLHVGQPLTSGWTLFRPLRLRSLRHGERDREKEEERKRCDDVRRDSPPPFRLPWLAELSDWELLAPSPSELDFTRFSFSEQKHRAGRQKGKERKWKVQSVRTSCDSGSSNHRARVVVLQRTVCLHAAQMWLKVSLNSLRCSQILYSLCAKWNIPGRLLLQFWWLSRCSMRTIRHRRSLLKSLKAVSKNINRQAQQEKVHKQQRRPQTLNGCKKQSNQESITRADRLVSQHREQQQHTVVFRTEAPTTSFPTSPILNQTLHQKCLV